MQRIEDVKKGLACHALCRNRLLACSDCAYHGPGLPPCGKAVHEDAIAMLEQLQAQVPKWISVGERLPEQYATVIIWRDDCKNASIGWLISGYWSVPKGVRVTHWMPMPEPPKEE
jgi:hypothetical protein